VKKLSALFFISLLGVLLLLSACNTGSSAAENADSENVAQAATLKEAAEEEKSVAG